MEITPFTHDNKLGAVQEVLEKKKVHTRKMSFFP